MSDPGWTLAVLAAGVGSRYGGNKQLDTLGPDGEVLSDYAVADAAKAGARGAVFVIRAELEAAFRDHHARRRHRMRITYAHQRLDDLPAGYSVPPGRTRPWGTTQAVLAARSQVSGAFVVVNADDLYGPEALAAAGQFLSVSPSVRPSVFAAIAFPLAETLSPHGGVSRAILATDAEGWLVQIEERHGVERAANEWVSMNCWACPDEAFNLLEGAFEEFLREHHASLRAECPLPESIGSLIARGAARVRVLRAGHGWLGVTHAADREGVVAELRRRGTRCS